MAQIYQSKDSNRIRVVILDSRGHVVSRQEVQEEIPLLLLTMVKGKDGAVVLVPRKLHQTPQRVATTGITSMRISNVRVRSLSNVKGKRVVRPASHKAQSTDTQALVEYKDGLPLIHTQVPDDLVGSLRDLRDQQ